jgi:hypothetical protein
MRLWWPCRGMSTSLRLSGLSSSATSGPTWSTIQYNMNNLEENTVGITVVC